MLALNLPKERYIAALNISPLKNTLASLEFQRDKDYPVNDSGSGQQSKVMCGDGKYVNIMMVRLSAYF